MRKKKKKKHKIEILLQDVLPGYRRKLDKRKHQVDMKLTPCCRTTFRVKHWKDEKEKENTSNKHCRAASPKGVTGSRMSAYGARVGMWSA
jgi:hypothetical protein